MVNILVGDRNKSNINILRQKFTEDNKFKIQNAVTGKDTILEYWKLNPDILVLNNNLQDMSIEEIINKLSCSPIEKKKCNTILILPSKNNFHLTDVQKINKIIYNSNYKKQLISFIKELGLDYNTPDLELGEIDWLLQSLNFNCMSPRIYLYERCHHILLL